MQHNWATASQFIQGLLESAARTADIIMIQAPLVCSDFTSTVSHPSFEALLPQTPAGNGPRVMAILSSCNRSLKVSRRPDLSPHTDIQILEVSTSAIPPFRLVHISNKRRDHLQQYTLERALGCINIPTRSVLASTLTLIILFGTPLPDSTSNMNLCLS